MRIGHQRRSRVASGQAAVGGRSLADEHVTDAPLDGRRARDAPATLGHEAITRLQLVGPGKMLRTAGAGWHYTITKAASPAEAYTDQFHVTFEQGAAAGHPHFYFSDLGSYQSTWETTKQNENFKNRKGGTAAFPKLKEQAKAHASTLIARPDFPAYEGSSIEDIAARKAQAAKDKAAAEALVESQKAKETANVRTLNITITTPKAKGKVATFATWLQTQAPGSTAAVKVAGANALSAVLTFADFAAATAGLPLVHHKAWNEKTVYAVMPDA